EDGIRDRNVTGVQTCALPILLEDSTAEMAGVTFFGAADPRRTVFGSGAQLETELTADQYAQRLRDEACETDFDIMLIHDAAVGAPSLRAGCADYALRSEAHTSELQSRF